MSQNRFINAFKLALIFLIMLIGYPIIGILIILAVVLPIVPVLDSFADPTVWLIAYDIVFVVVLFFLFKSNRMKDGVKKFLKQIRFNI